MENSDKTILAVDDSSSIRQMVGFTLREAGYDVIEAADGSDAIKKLGNKKVNMIITDLNMPNLDGIGLIKYVRGQDAFHRYVPILMLTTESQQEKKMEGKSAGATGWIIKPFRPEQLLAVVQKVMPKST